MEERRGKNRRGKYRTNEGICRAKKIEMKTNQPEDYDKE